MLAELIRLKWTVAIAGTPVTPTGTIDIASGGFVALKSKGNSFATLLAWQNAGMVQNTGKGLTSSWVLSNPDFGLAVVDNATLGLTSFHGRDVTADSLIVAPALLGDANLDSLVNFDDLVKVAENYETAGGAWVVGDFNYDSLVNSIDLSMIEQNYGATPAEFDVAWALARGISPLFGDYNDDGVVDAADYTTWRDSVGSPAGSLPNDPNSGVVIGSAQYATWRTNFGARQGGAGGGSPVPEPGAMLLMACAAVSAVASRRGLRIFG